MFLTCGVCLSTRGGGGNYLSADGAVPTFQLTEEGAPTFQLTGAIYLQADGGGGYLPSS